MPKFTESQLEEAIVELFQAQGYDHINGDKLHRKYDDILLEEDMRKFLKHQYPNLTDTELEKIINKIKYIPKTPLYMGNREAFYLVNEGFNLVRDDLALAPVHIEYIDFENPENNIFKVVNQYTVQDVRERRPDLILFINGLPIAIFEFKTAIQETTTVYDAWY